jgi:hypothetical protein
MKPHTAVTTRKVMLQRIKTKASPVMASSRKTAISIMPKTIFILITLTPWKARLTSYTTMAKICIILSIFLSTWRLVHTTFE